MTVVTFILGLILGAWAEHGFDVSGRIYVLWRRFQAWRRG